jgi:hypothetical protein
MASFTAIAGWVTRRPAEFAGGAVRSTIRPAVAGHYLAGGHRRRRWDTNRDTHEVEIAHPTGAPIAAISISNDSTGYAQLLAWIFDHAPGSPTR